MSQEKLVCLYQIDKQKDFSKLGNRQEICVAFYYSLGAVAWKKRTVLIIISASRVPNSQTRFVITSPAKVKAIFTLVHRVGKRVCHNI